MGTMALYPAPLTAPASAGGLGAESYPSRGTGRHAPTRGIPTSNAERSQGIQSPAHALKQAQDGTLSLLQRLPVQLSQSVARYVLTLK